MAEILIILSIDEHVNKSTHRNSRLSRPRGCSLASFKVIAIFIDNYLRDF